MASALRIKAATGLLSRSCTRLQPVRSTILPTLTQTTKLVQQNTFDAQRRLFSCSGALNESVIVKVPPMAESISEGTLSQVLQVGDSVEADGEVASIETDKIDVAVNAPEAGVIKELFAQEGDTVVVGQDLARIETGGEGGSAKKEDAPKKEEEPKKAEETKPKEESKPKEDKVEKKEPAPQAAKPQAPPPASAPNPLPKAKPEAATTSSGAPTRTERPVSAFESKCHKIGY